jgi:transcriptional regulator with XRE-family HTH domain
VAAGLSLRTVARAIGVSHTHVGRFERDSLASPSVAFLCAYCDVLGLELSVRAYPAGDPLRDAGQRRLLGRLRNELHADLQWREEVPLPDTQDRRAWDAAIAPAEGTWCVRVEAEVRVTDGQSLQRRLALKVRDGGPGHVLLLLADTRHNRLALSALRQVLRPTLPLDQRAVLAALRAGEDPGGSGIVVL